MSMQWEERRFDPHHYHEDDDYYEDWTPENVWIGIRNGLLMTIPFWVLIAAGIFYAVHKYHQVVK